MFMKLTKNRYLTGFVAVVLVLACVRWMFPQVAKGHEVTPVDDQPVAAVPPKPVLKARHNPIRSVPNYQEAFPDTNGLQLTAANQWGVTPVGNRADAESRKRELVYVGSNPYYHVDPLYSSIPYLVPRAAVLLQDIGQAFFDSLYVKGVPRRMWRSCAAGTAMPRRTPATSTAPPSTFATIAIRRSRILTALVVVRCATTR